MKSAAIRLWMIILLSLVLLPASAQDGTSGDPSLQIPEKDQQELRVMVESMLLVTTRMIIATAFADPQLTVQELDSLTVVVRKLEKAVVKWPSLKAEFAPIYNVLELTRLATMAEFGLTDEFERQIIPNVEESKISSHRASSLITGFRTSLEHGRLDQAQRFLNLSVKLVEQEADELDAVYLYCIASFPVMLRSAHGESISQAELDRVFTQSWSAMKDYDPLADLSSNVSWYHGRYVTKFWLTEYLQRGNVEGSALAPAVRQLQSWVTTFDPSASLKETEDDLERIDQAQGAITYITSMMDISMFPYEESPELLKNESVGDFHGMMQQCFDYVDEIADSLSKILSVPGYAPVDYKNTVYLESLKIRSAIILGLDDRKSLTERAETLAALPQRIEKLNTPASYIATNLRLGEAFLSIGREAEAVSAWKRALRRSQDFGLDLWTTQAAKLLAQEYARQGDWVQSGNYSGLASSKLLDRLGSEDSARLYSQSDKIATEQVTALIHADQPEKALEVLNHGRQFGLATAQVEGDPKTKGALRELALKKNTLDALSENVARLESMPASETRDSLLEKAQVSLAGSRSEFLTESRKIRAKFSKLYSSTLKFDPLDLAEIQGTLAPGTAVVQYFPTEQELYFFVVTKEKFSIRSLKVEKSKIDELVLSFLAQLRKISAKEKATAQELYALLIKPVESDIAGSDQLVLIPTGRLNILPFGALLGERRLIEDKKLVELAKTTDFLKISSESPRPLERAITFANATLDLPGTVQEGRVVRSLFPESQLFQGPDASKANLAKFGAEADVLHLATHGVWDATDSLKNYLSLSNGETLDQEDIFGLDLSETSMVTLSACNTALGDSQDLGYVSSLAEAFWIAGSRSVVASLWAVEDGATSDLMEEFYRGLKSGRTRAEALRDAQRSVMKKDAYQHPYYWSGFLLFGDYR